MRVEQIGDATLYCGDCLEILPTLDKVDAVVTDPPYGIKYKSGQNKDSNILTNDGIRISLRLYKKIIPILNGLPILWFTRWDTWPDVWEIFAQYMQINGLLIWNKNVPGMGNLNHWGCSYEMIVSAGPVKIIGKREGNVINIKMLPPSNRYHPNEKPEELIKYLIKKITKIENTILDPFMGSGTTGVACVNLGRKFIGIEIEPKYFDIACKRIEQAQEQLKLAI